MNTLDKIDYIKSIIRDFGTFHVNEVKKTTIPVLFKDSETSIIKQVERYHEHKVEVETYMNGDYVDTDYVSYENLPGHVIEQILIVIQDFQEQLITK